VLDYGEVLGAAGRELAEARATPRRLAGAIVVGATVLIAHLDARDARHERLLAAAGASTLTLAEVLPAARSAGASEVPTFDDRLAKNAGRALS
jgi:hypothetical protein